MDCQIGFEHLTYDQQSSVIEQTMEDPELELWEVLAGIYETNEQGHVWLIEARDQ